MAGVARLRLPVPGAANGHNSCWKNSANGPSASACPSPPAPPRPISTRFRSSSSPTIPATARSNAASRASSAGTPWRWWSARTSSAAASAGISPPSPRPPRSMKWPSTTSSAETGAEPPDQVFFQGHATPGIYARAYLLGRLTEQQLVNFRREMKPGGGLSSYPHPWLMPDFWEFPTVSMGLGPIMAIYQARFNHYLVDRGIKPDAKASRVWAFLGDGECDEPETLGAITLAAREGLGQPDLRHQLQSAAAGRTGPRQRQDRAGAGRRLPRRRLERDQGPVGLRLGPAAGQGHRGAAGPPHGRGRRRPVAEVLGHARGLCPRAFLRHRSAAEGDGRRPERRAVAQAPPRRPRSAEGLRGLRAALETRGAPTVILAQTIKGYGMGEAGEGRNITHQQKKLNEQELLEFPPASTFPSARSRRPMPSSTSRRGSPEMVYLRQRGRRGEVCARGRAEA